MGKGYIQNVRLKSGIQLNIANYTLQRPITMDLEPPFKPIGFGFWLSGHSRIFSAGQEAVCRGLFLPLPFYQSI